MNFWKFVRDNCPTLNERIKADIDAGLFDPYWRIHSDENQKYFSDILGREIKSTESILKTFVEAECKLKNE